MSKYRKVIYENYHSTQVNKAEVNYEQLLQQQSFYYKKELTPFLPKDKNATILDIGCGFGSFISAAKSSGYQNVTGIDLSPEQVEVAHKLNIPEVKLQSAEDWFAENENLDCIVGVDIIEHFTKDELVEFLIQCKKALNPGGSLVFRTPNMDAHFASVYAHADFSHEVFLNKSSAKQVMAACGFHKVEVFPSMIYNRNGLKESLRKIMWSVSQTFFKISLFASGRTWDDVVFTPNLIIKASVD
ncbi:class I SAM-dependent methyltransferase [bacterium]|nr:class I SAM-dependent methyltransferase [bacterium]